MHHKQKRMVYAGIIVALLLFGCLFFGFILSTANKASLRTLQNLATQTVVRLENILQYHARDLINTAAQDTPQVKGSYAGSISGMDQKGQLNLSNQYLLLDKDGSAYDMNGAGIGKITEPTVLAAALTNGYAITGITDQLQQEDPLLFVVPLLPEEELYAAHTLSVDEFSMLISQSMTIQPSHLALFNEWGGVVTNTVSSDDALDKALQSGVQDATLRQTGQRIRQKGIGQNYLLYFSLSQPNGWTVGVYIPEHELSPLFSNMMIAASVSVLFWMLVIAAMFLLDTINDKSHQTALFRMQYMDKLTGLLNESGMLNAYTDFFSTHPMKSYNMICLDISGFHRFNVMFGYSVGDTLLKVVADVLRKQWHCATRTSGDGFVFLAPKGQFGLEEFEDFICRRVSHAMGDEYCQMIAINIGVYPITDSGTNVREMYDKCMIALRAAKKNTSRNIEVYGDEVKKNADMQRKIEINMLHALSKEEFEIYIQPKYSLRYEKWCGGEALVRWHSENLGVLPPDQFIPFFEENGFIIEIDLFMLTQVLSIQQARYDAQLPFTPISVNQSKYSILFPNYKERLKRIIDTFTVPLYHVEIELTESILESDYARIVSIMMHLKSIGFLVSMDDFGSGFSSLNTLRELPVDVLKIDKEFLRESNTSERSKKIIQSIVNMAHELTIQVVCEGVETKDQLSFLKKVECDIVQGYLFSPPIPVHEYEKSFISLNPGNAEEAEPAHCKKEDDSSALNQTSLPSMYS